MKYTVKTLLQKGVSQRSISKELGISRKTVKKYLCEFEQHKEVLSPKIKRSKKLDPFCDDIENWLSQGLTGILIKDKLFHQKGINVGYATISRFLLKFKIPEVYVPLLAKPGEEAQVDFGYLGKFIKNGKFVKTWCFSMVLSHSRYSFHCLVTDQSVKTFIWCHIMSFEYFSGVVQTVKIDNLKAGVITPNFYEPTIQRQYAEFLEYYDSAPITARIRRGQDKGKVEAGVKYVKNNFLKSIEHNDYFQLEKDLSLWTNDTCNKRIHGTTKKVPQEVFSISEKQTLKQLPLNRYEPLIIEQRKVNNYGHISFKNNYYSVPCKYTGKLLVIKSTPTLLKIYDDTVQIALHAIASEQGQFITNEEHKPVEKQRKSEQHYIQKAIDFGSDTHEFLLKLKEQKPFSWQKMMQGVFNLKHHYSIDTVNMACKRANQYGALGYISIKNICKNKLYNQNKEALSIPSDKGFSHNLKQYDQLLNN